MNGWVCLYVQVKDSSQNEFVKNYLQQREKLLKEQMTQKKEIEGKSCISAKEMKLMSRPVTGNAPLCNDDLGMY